MKTPAKAKVVGRFIFELREVEGHPVAERISIEHLKGSPMTLVVSGGRGTENFYKRAAKDEGVPSAVFAALVVLADQGGLYIGKEVQRTERRRKLPPDVLAKMQRALRSPAEVTRTKEAV